MSDIISQKYCPACEQTFDDPPESFHKNNKSPDKLNRICKSCNSKKSSAHKKKKRALRPPRQLKTHCPQGHPLIEGNLRKGKRECLTCHRERERARKESKPGIASRPKKKDGYCAQGHPLVEGNVRTGKNAGACLTCHRESGRRRYHKNPEKMVAQASAYAKSHREKVNERWREYRKQERFKQRERLSHWKRVSQHDPETVQYVEVLWNDPCAYCGKPMEHIDHIDPAAKGGESHWTNLTASCRRCNQRKQDMTLLQFLAYRQTYPDTGA